jgi:peptidoglycan hydrolase CwlO-like protein
MQTTVSDNSANTDTSVVVPAVVPAAAAAIPLSIEPCSLSTMEEHIIQLEAQLQQLQQSIQSKSAEIYHAKRRINYIRKSQIKNASSNSINKDGSTKKKRFRKVMYNRWMY